jgi:type I restriction-modification system DNA methylase subunit
MAPTRRPRQRPQTASELHRAWLELVETDGPFLAIPPLKRVWPQGMPALTADRLDALRTAKPGFDHAWEALDLDPHDSVLQDKYRSARDEWVQAVLRDVVGWRDALVWGPDCAAGVLAHSPDRRVTVAPDAALRGPDGIGALVLLVDCCDSLHDTGTDGWAATPIDRVEALLRTAGVPIGIVTDGRWWALVCARPDAMVASGVVDALTWVEEPLARDALLTVIGRLYIVGGDPDERLPKLFEKSVAEAEEITEALGVQVRHAVEGLVQAFAETAAEARRRGQPDPLPANPHDAYSAAVTVLMRVVFLLFAEERALLPQGQLFQEGYGISGELDALERRRLAEGEESLDSTFLGWHRLLATSQAIYHGASFENMRMPAYGGSLFDLARYPFLTATAGNGTLALPVSDLVMLHVLRAVQVAQLTGGDARRISFREVDVEQIGYIYEGLIGYTCIRVTGDPQLGLRGTAGTEPEIPLAVLEDLAAHHATPAGLAAAIIAWVKETQPAAKAPTPGTLAKLLATPVSEDDDRQLRAVTAGDDRLRARLRRWAPILRHDLRDRPMVVLHGGLLVAETASRRNAGAHYTPKRLADEVVRHALEPLCYYPGPHQTPDESAWRLRGSDEILALKVADIAVGSGAFLVAAARYLADRLVEAWRDEDPSYQDRRDLHQHAIREVVARCLYGADINAMAVEMCKLSLWLVSLDRDLPFSFVDDKILHGNSLLGLTELHPLRALHIDPPPHFQPRLIGVDMDDVLARAKGIRRELASEVREYDPQRSTSAKRRQLRRQHELTTQLAKIADGVVATGLRFGGKPGRALDEAYENLSEAVRLAYPLDGSTAERGMLDDVIQAGLTPTVPTDYDRWQTLHWVLETPDIVMDHGGFDAIVGNPPFLGGSKLTGTMGTNVRDWMVHRLAGGTRGNADLVAYFLLRALTLLRSTGTLGLIATNTVAQGDTREIGLDQAVKKGLTLTRSVQSASWPAASANLEYAAIWATRNAVADRAARIADGVMVPRISTLLEASGRVDEHPRRLKENDNVAFSGCKVTGSGFILEPSEARNWISEDARYWEVLFPYLNGEDLNSHPDCSASRWVIDFNDWPEERAASYIKPFERIYRRVRPERSKSTTAVGMQQYWWLFERSRPEMRAAISGLSEVLAITRHSVAVMPVRIRNNAVMSSAMIVFATDAFEDQAVLSSNLHQVWAITYGSTLETRVRYTPSDVFETFPRPAPTDLLSEVGETLDRQRREIMLRRRLGLTKLYNLLNDAEIPDRDDPDVARLREIHVSLDEAVMDAYGWGDVVLGHGFHSCRQMVRWTVSPAARVEILDRLLAENLRRFAAQGGPVKKASRGRRAVVAEEQGTLL